MSVIDVNQQFYNRLYRRRRPLVSIIYSLISFDQQSKSKVNYLATRNFFKEKFKRPLFVLDYGFGHGSLLLKYGRKHRLYGCDISEEAVVNFPKVAAFVGKEVKTTTVDSFCTSFKDLKFDVITLSHIIEHVEDDVHLIKTLCNYLSDQGVVLINIPINEVWQDPKHARRYDLTYTKQMLQKCDLTIESYCEADKLTSFFLIEEKVKNAGTVKIYFIKILRAIFSITPLSITRLFENLFLKNHKNQQLVVLATKR